MSTKGDQSASLNLSPFFGKRMGKVGKPPNNVLKRFRASSISRSGFHVINLFIFLPFWRSVKAILVHRANRLLSESTLILCTLKNRPGGKQTPGDFTRLRSIPEPHAFSTVVFCGLEDFFDQSYAIPRNTLQLLNHQTRRRCLPCS